MKRAWILLLLVGLAPMCRRPAGEKSAAATATDDGGRRVVLQIGDVSRSNDDFQRFLRQQYASALPADASPQLLSRLFDRFTEQELLLFQANRDGITVSEEETRAATARLPADARAAAVDPQQISAQLVVEKVLYYRVYRDIRVEPREVEAYYNQHIDDYRKSEEVQLQQIVVRDHDKAVRLRSELLNAPGRFEEIARRESVSPEAASGGQMGYFERGVLPTEMENIVFALQVNEISPITETPYGFHIFKVTRIKKKRLLAFASVSGEIRDQLLAEKLRDASRDFLSGLRQQLPVTLRTGNLHFAYVPPQTNEVNHEPQRPSPVPGPAAPAGRP